MVVGLVPYRWVTDRGTPCWALPEGVTSSIDLRRVGQITDTAATGYAIATYPTSLPAGSVSLSSGSVAVRRSAWQSTLGYLPQGNTPEEWVFDHLLNGADDTFAASCRPLRCIGPDRVEMHLGGQRFERLLNGSERLQQAVFVRRDLDVIFDDVQAGRLPDGMHRKALQAYADDLGIDPLTLRSKAARWRNETPLRPTTQITDAGSSGGSQSLTSYGWTESGTVNKWTTGSGLFTFAGSSATQSWAWHPTSLSSSNNQSSCVNGTSNTSVTAAICRGNGGTGSSGTAWNGYIADNWSGETNHRMYSVVSGVGTLIGTVSRGSSPQTYSIRAIGSSVLCNAGSPVTNTAVTTGLRVGVYGFGSGGNDTIETFTARDFLTPASISTSPSSGPTAGGTSITITGTGFESNATVTVKGGSATGVSIASETSLTATTPSGTLGAGDVVVTNPDSGLSGTQSNGFTYVAPSTTTLSISPTRRRR